MDNKNDIRKTPEKQKPLPEHLSKVLRKKLKQKENQTIIRKKDKK